jgi:hypothetical protein
MMMAMVMVITMRKIQAQVRLYRFLQYKLNVYLNEQPRYNMMEAIFRLHDFLLVATFHYSSHSNYDLDYDDCDVKFFRIFQMRNGE